MIKMNHWLIFFLLIFPMQMFGQNFSTYTFDVYFDPDKDAIDLEAASVIRNKIIEIGSSQIREVYLSGHADSDADDDYNAGLSKRRAEHTRDFLMSQGVPSRLIKLKAFGESMPVSDHKQLNRRVQVTLMYHFEYENGSKRLIIKGRVKNGQTGKRMGADYALEQKERNIFGKSSRLGDFALTVSSNGQARIIVSRNGFLSDVKEVTVADIQRFRGDTMVLDFVLHPVKVVEKITFKNIYFFTDKDVLKPESKQDLMRLLVMLKNNQDLYIQIQGHVNFPKYRELSPALEMWNRDLSHRRAKAVYDYLVTNGVEPSRLSYIGLSNKHMLHPYPASKEEADKNKRVEIWKMKKI